MYVLLLGLKWALTQNKFSAAHHPKLSEQSGPGGHALPPPSPIFWQISKLYLNQGPRRDCGHVDVGMCPHQVLAATLTRGGELYSVVSIVLQILSMVKHPILFQNHQKLLNEELKKANLETYWNNTVLYSSPPLLKKVVELKTLLYKIC